MAANGKDFDVGGVGPNDVIGYPDIYQVRHISFCYLTPDSSLKTRSAPDSVT